MSNVFVQQNHVFIEPSDCGSAVGYYLGLDEYDNVKEKRKEYSLSATVVLSDCQHKIDWSFSENTDEEKIDNAIHMLQEFRKNFVSMKKKVQKMNEKKEG